MLYQEKAPYLLTLLFSALAWTVAQVAEDAARNPVLEYKKQTMASGEATSNVFTLTNISSDRALSGITVKLRIKKEGDAMCIEQPKMLIFPPMELSDPDGKEEASSPEYIDDICASYRIPKLQPGAIVRLTMKTNKNVPVEIYVWSKDTVKVVEASLQTRIIKRKFTVLVFLIVLWSLLILIYMYAVSRRTFVKPDAKEIRQ